MTKLEEFLKIYHISETLEGAEILENFSLNEIDTIYNGIGSDEFPDWLRELVTISAGLFEPAALIHDLDYYIGGDWEKFKVDNDRFERNCKKLVKRKYGWYNPVRYLWLNKARRWANYCRIFGWSAYNHRGEYHGN